MTTILRRIFLDNALLKVVALVLALTLFFLIRSQVGEQTQRVIDNVPVLVRGVMGQTAIVDWMVEPPQVVLILKGGRFALEKLKDNHFLAYVTIDDATLRHTRRKRPVQIEGVRLGIAVQVHPAEVVVTRSKGP